MKGLRFTAPFEGEPLDPIPKGRGLRGSIGHPAGDALLQQVAACLTQVVQGEGTAFRIGGDGFGLLFPGESGPRCAQETRLLDHLINPGGERLYWAMVTACFPGEAGDVEGVRRLADRRLYVQKTLTPRGQAAARQS